MRGKKISTVFQYLFFLGLGLGLIWYSGKDLTDEQILQLKESFKQTQFLYLIPVVFCLLLAHYSRALRWIILMKTLGYNPGRVNTFLAVLVGYFFNLLVPRLGEVMKCTILAKYEKVAPDKLVGTIVAERALDVVGLLLITIFMIISQFDVIGSFTGNAIRKLIAAKGGGIDWINMTILLGSVIAFVLLTIFLFRRFKHSKIIITIKKIASGIWEGLLSIKHVKQPYWFLFHTLFIWLLYLGSIYIGFKAFPAVEHLGLRASVALLVFGSLGMIATQGGIGAYQLAVEKTLMLYGISAIAGLAFGWVLWGVQTAIILFSGLVAIILLPIFNRNITHAKSQFDPSKNS